LIPTTQFATRPERFSDDAAAKSIDYVRRHWKYREPAGNPADLLERAQSHTLCISGMVFQDAWNVDLERLQRCCIHVATPGKKLVPFCAYYMTGSDGRRLYRNL
jgi:7,8-dihydro-6-hydroxymethylpterin dimethyltransferase